MHIQKVAYFSFSAIDKIPLKSTQSSVCTKDVSMHMDSKEEHVPTNMLEGQNCPYLYLTELVCIIFGEKSLDNSDVPSERLRLQDDQACYARIWLAEREGV